MVSWADRATFSEGDLGVETVSHFFADYLVAEDSPSVTDTDPAGLRFPHILITIPLPILHTAACLLCAKGKGRVRGNGTWGRRGEAKERKPEGRERNRVIRPSALVTAITC